MLGHKNYTQPKETYQGFLPASKANEIANLFAAKKSEIDAFQTIRIDGQKINLSVIKEVYGHIRKIEETVVNILNGTSIIYEYNQSVLKPENTEELLELVMDVIMIDGNAFDNVYDCSFAELRSQIGLVVSNIIEVNDSFEKLKAAHE